jgi:hypothetical protein
MKKQIPLSLSVLLLCFACTKNDDGGETGETGETGQPLEEPVELVFETGDCHPESELNAGTALEFVELSASGDAWDSTPAVIRSQEELDAWHAENNLEIDTSGVDFGTQTILFSQVTLGSTCGALPPVVHVVEMDGAPHLSLELTNPDGACDAVCDMTAQSIELVAVQKIDGEIATVCAREIATCDQ